MTRSEPMRTLPLAEFLRLYNDSAYPVAFLFPREEDCFWSAPEVPEWVTKVNILEDNTLQIA